MTMETLSRQLEEALRSLTEAGRQEALVHVLTRAIREVAALQGRVNELDLSQTFSDLHASCARTQHSLTFGCGFGFHPVRFLSQIESSWARQSANSPKNARKNFATGPWIVRRAVLNE